MIKFIKKCPHSLVLSFHTCSFSCCSRMYDKDSEKDWLWLCGLGSDLIQHCGKAQQEVYDNTGHTVPLSQEAERWHMVGFTLIPVSIQSPWTTDYPHSSLHSSVHPSGNIPRHTPKTPKIPDPVDQVRLTNHARIGNTPRVFCNGN